MNEIKQVEALLNQLEKDYQDICVDIQESIPPDLIQAKGCILLRPLCHMSK